MNSKEMNGLKRYILKNVDLQPSYNMNNIYYNEYKNGKNRK